MANKLLSRPTLVGMMRESPNYVKMNVGTTDTVLLIGHADANTMYEPYQVIDIQKAVNFLGADTKSPLLRSLLECYNGGCRDIWLYAAAPMSEYVDTISRRMIDFYPLIDGNTLDQLAEENLLDGGISLDYIADLILDGGMADDTGIGIGDADGGMPEDDADDLDGGAYPWTDLLSFYERWHQRLDNAYAALKDWDVFEIIVPIEAVFYDAGGVDFATQLISYCSSTFTNTGAVLIGVLGTRIPTPTAAAISTMAADNRIADFSADGKFVMIVVGEGIINHPQISTSYVGSLSTQIASQLATVNMNRSIAGLRLPNVSSVVGPDYTADQLEAMTQAKLNPVVRSQKGKRGFAYQSKLLTDNTLGKDGSDFWSMAQMHIVANCINQIRAYGYAYIGETQTNKFNEAVYAHLRRLVLNSYIKDFSLNIELTERNSKATVTVGISPIFGIRNIYFTAIVGPGI